MTPLNKLITYIDSYKDDIVNQQTIREYAVKLIDEEREVIEDAFQYGKWNGYENAKDVSEMKDPSEYYNETFKNNKYHGNTKKNKGVNAETSKARVAKTAKKCDKNRK